MFRCKELMEKRCRVVHVVKRGEFEKIVKITNCVLTSYHTFDFTMITFGNIIYFARFA